MITRYNVVLAPHTEGHPLLVKEETYPYNSDSVHSPDAVVKMLNACMGLETRAEEYAYMVAVDSACHVLGIFEVAHGTVNSALIGMREIFIRALLSGAAAIFLVHNHPGANPAPSQEDKQVCQRTKETCALMGIRLMDFIIVSRGGRYWSFMEKKML
ncbi:MAG: JAB domain-containing protein [Clostridiales bacterium]|nr:JAB domain-containing protein [Clostridiales bacterium]